MSTQPCVYIVDDDYALRDSLGLVFKTAGLNYLTFENAEHFLETYSGGTPGCLLLDMNMPGLNGDELQVELIRRDIHLPIIFLTAYGDIPMSVRAIKAGAVDFLTKPVPSKLLLERIQTVLQHEALTQEQNREKEELRERLNCLTYREMELLPLIVAGKSNKEIARQLDFSHRTVEIHRARILKKPGQLISWNLSASMKSASFNPKQSQNNHGAIENQDVAQKDFIPAPTLTRKKYAELFIVMK